MSSVNSAFSLFRCIVASSTSLSSSVMPACSVLISSASVAMVSAWSSTDASKSSMLCASPFALSSTLSICFRQYSRLPSSSVCSCASSAIMSSTILITFEKSTFPPCKTSSRNRISGSAAVLLPPFPRRACRAAMARRCTRSRSAANCKKLELGKAFLKRSSASSSLRILMVSWIATSSCARSFFLSSHSACLLSQFCVRSFRNFWSWIKIASACVRSCFMRTTCTCKSPTRATFFSIDLLKVFTSFLLAAMRSS
mmetsp:Transcript_1896/g.4450  ORF Transcript_1896/g.4450 Transcript_1896/m.4450 type:complete len:255 (+) Transcript_1896:776-1540(+)